MKEKQDKTERISYILCWVFTLLKEKVITFEGSNKLLKDNLFPQFWLEWYIVEICSSVLHDTKNSRLAFHLCALHGLLYMSYYTFQEPFHDESGELTTWCRVSFMSLSNNLSPTASSAGIAASISTIRSSLVKETATDPMFDSRFAFLVVPRMGVSHLCPCAEPKPMPVSLESISSS